MDEEIARIRQDYEILRGTEHAKNNMIEQLLVRLEQLNDTYEKELLDHKRETAYNRDSQLREKKLYEDLRKIKAETERDPSVLVLIDGDGMIFEDALLSKGEAGGREAANQLWSAVRDYMHEIMPDINPDYKIVARVYANQKGLADACHRAGILDRPFVMEEFARGFTGSKQLFDFIDVGSGKDRADEKITELFKLNFNNLHCRHIIFGCSHDNGYARLLEDVSGYSKVTLLEGVPFEREIALLKPKFGHAKFDNVFRTSKINLYQHQYHQPQQIHLPSAPQALTMASVMSTPTQSYGSMPNGLSNGAGTGYQPPYQQPIARPPSTPSNSSVPTSTSWATKAVSGPPGHTVQLASPPQTPTPATIPRNKYGQRLDTLGKYDPTEFKRVQKIKMCNVHFLRQDCPYGDECTHDHFYKPNKNELETLRQVARSTPCKWGTGCDDVKCIYGHRCPHSVEGQRICRFGDNCRFDTEMHGVDLKAVRTTKVF